MDIGCFVPLRFCQRNFTHKCLQQASSYRKRENSNSSSSPSFCVVSQLIRDKSVCLLLIIFRDFNHLVKILTQARTNLDFTKVPKVYHRVNRKWPRLAEARLVHQIYLVSLQYRVEFQFANLLRTLEFFIRNFFLRNWAQIPENLRNF